VVAVLDTGIGSHPWLDVPSPDEDLPGDGFVRVDPELQAAIMAEELRLQGTGAVPVEILDTAWDSPIAHGTLAAEVDTHAGHGTFIAGLIRQLAPDAEVRSIRVMHSDGVVYESDLLLALRVLAARLAHAQASGQPAEGDLVDVVSLSLGYFDEAPEDGAYTTQLAAVVNQLSELGVLVVAAAGNFATDQPFFPAALATAPSGDGPPVASVGALNPNETKAMFSNDGSWVTWWASGAALVSTYPVSVRGPLSPAASVTAANLPTLPQRRDTLDADDFTSGFATWSGTSFAAPLLAGQVAAALLAGAETDPKRTLASVDPADTIRRVNQALADVPGAVHG
jgi:subtilisin family serine protease